MSVTHFAPAARSMPDELERDIRLIVDNPIQYTGDTHSDNIQTYWVDDMTIDNNYMYQSSPTKVLGTQALFTQEANSGATHVYYNNVIYANEPNKNDATIRTKANDGKTVYNIHEVEGYTPEISHPRILTEFHHG